MRFKVPKTLFSAGPVLGVLCLGVCLWLILTHNPWKVLAADPELNRLRSMVRFYGWWAAAINAFLLAGLALTARWWAPPRMQTVAYGCLRSQQRDDFGPLFLQRCSSPGSRASSALIKAYGMMRKAV